MKTKETPRHVSVIREAACLVEKTLGDISASGKDVSVELVRDAFTKHKAGIDPEMIEDVLYVANKFMLDGAKFALKGNEGPKPEGKAITFNLVVDEDRSRVLHMMISATQLVVPELYTMLLEEGLADAYENLGEELNDREHEMNWCPDPECKYGKEV